MLAFKSMNLINVQTFFEEIVTKNIYTQAIIFAGVLENNFFNSNVPIGDIQILQIPKLSAYDWRFGTIIRLNFLEII